MTSIIIILSGAAISAAVMLWVEHSSPRGYEDESGFHFGDEPRPLI